MRRLAKLFLLLATILLIWGFINNQSSTFTLVFSKPNLQKTLQKALDQAEGRYGIFIKNFKTGETYKLKEDEVFEAGSLYKLWVMGAVFEKIKQGEIKEDDELVADVARLNEKFDIDEEDAEFPEGIIDFSVKSAIEQMIAISHNYAALALLDKIGSSQVTSFLEKYGLNQSSLGSPPKTSAEDIGIFFEKLYRSEIIDAEYSQKMMDILAKQKINDRIPKYLPESTRVVHKTGDTGFFEHDGGIIYTAKGDYIIVVLTQSNSPSDADEKIAQISKAVYDYFNRKQPF